MDHLTAAQQFRQQNPLAPAKQILDQAMPYWELAAESDPPEPSDSAPRLFMFMPDEPFGRLVAQVFAPAFDIDAWRSNPSVGLWRQWIAAIDAFKAHYGIHDLAYLDEEGDAANDSQLTC